MTTLKIASPALSLALALQALQPSSAAAQPRPEVPMLVAHVYDTSRSYQTDSALSPFLLAVERFPHIIEAIAALGPPSQQYGHFLVHVGKWKPIIVCRMGPLKLADIVMQPRRLEAVLCRNALSRESPNQHVDMAAGIASAATSLRDTQNVAGRGLVIYSSLVDAGQPSSVGGLDLRGLCVAVAHGNVAKGEETRAQIADFHDGWRSAFLAAGASQVMFVEVSVNDAWIMHVAGQLWPCLRRD